VAEKNYIQNFFKPTNPQKYVGNVNEIVFEVVMKQRHFIGVILKRVF